MQLFVLTLFTLTAFAANSLLNRAALVNDLIGAGEFASLRVAAGAFTLFFLLAISRKAWPKPQTIDIRAVLGLAAYMVGFSFAYVRLDAGLGALILFGTVQVAMFAAALKAGEFIPTSRSVGAVIALCGLGVLFWPGERFYLPWFGVLLMLIAALGWALYSLQGRKVADPLAATAWNFIYALPVPLIVQLLVQSYGGQVWFVTTDGALLAIASGAIMSGLGYALWYRVLPQLDVSIGALSQLLVPVIALVLGVLLLDESVDSRTLLAALLIVGGVAVGSLFAKQKPAH